MNHMLSTLLAKYVKTEVVVSSLRRGIRMLATFNA